MAMTTLPSPPSIDRGAVALFLDLDGTLAEITARPGEVGPVATRTTLLLKLSQALAGAVAVISGRGLEDIDRILEGAIQPVAAVHGLVRRRSDGVVHRAPASPALEEAKTVLQTLAKAHGGLITEDKGVSFALHYRQHPAAESAVLEATNLLAMTGGLVVQNGSMVSELRAVGPNKGDGLRAFMAEQAFAGRRPIMVGDDLTDEVAFAAAADLGGYGVLVGPPRATSARHALPSVEATLAWLATA